MTKPFITLLLLTVAINSGMGILIPVIPNLLKEFGFSTLGLSVPFAALIIARIISKPWAGGGIARFGRRKLMVMVFVVYSLTFLLYPLCDNPTAFVILRILEGFAEGIGGVVLTDYSIALTSGLANRGVLMGYFSAAFGAGYILGPILGWAALETVGTTGMFLTGGAVGVLGALGSIFMPQLKDKSLAATAVRFRAVAAYAIFLIPYVPSLLRRALFFSFMVVVPLFATDHLKMPAGDVGLLFTASAVMTTAFLPFTGKLADRFNSRLLAASCLAGMGVFIALCSFANSIEMFLVFYLSETLLFCVMLPAGVKIFAVAVDEHPLRSNIIGAFGSLTEVFTLGLAFILPALYNWNHASTWLFLSGLCVSSALLLLLGTYPIAASADNAIAGETGLPRRPV